MKEEKPDKEIASQNGKKGILGFQDQIRLFFDACEKNEHYVGIPTWRKKRKESFQIEKNAEEWAANIYHNGNLSQYKGNPDYYPPVPTQLSPIYNVLVSKSMVQVILTENLDEIEQYSLDLQKITEIDPKIFSNTKFNIGTITIFDYFDSDTGISTYIQRLGAHITLILDPKSNTSELINIYAFKNPNNITRLIAYLDTLNIKNHDELIEIRIKLGKLIMSMFNK